MRCSCLDWSRDKNRQQEIFTTSFVEFGRRDSTLPPCFLFPQEESDQTISTTPSRGPSIIRHLMCWSLRGILIFSFPKHLHLLRTVTLMASWFGVPPWVILSMYLFQKCFHVDLYYESIDW